MTRVEDITEPLVVGKEYLVPCIIDVVKKSDIIWDVGDISLQLTKDGKYATKILKESDVAPILFIYPVINHFHSDKENGQDYKHYHVDYRFIEMKGDRPKKRSKNHVYAPEVRISKGSIEYYPLECIRQENLFITPKELIKKSKLKHNCIYKNKCPHRGYNLSNEPIIDGVITCPLHGLRFNSITKQIL